MKYQQSSILQRLNRKDNSAYRSELTEAAAQLRFYSLRQTCIMGMLTSSKIKKISPQLVVADIERSLEFYTKQLDFALDFQYEDFYAGISKDGCSIHLKAGKPLMDERKNKRDNEDLDIVLSVDGVEDLYEEFLGRSIRFIQTLREMPYGKEFYIADPDGYILGFLEDT